MTVTTVIGLVTYIIVISLYNIEKNIKDSRTNNII